VRANGLGETCETPVQPRWQRMRQECQPQQFSCNLTFRPVRMFLLDTRFGKRTREQAHFQRQEEPLFFGHCSLNLKLDGLRLRTRIGDGHEQNVNTESSDQPPAIAPMISSGSFPDATASGN
jgi:hypothetical protein